MKRIDRSPRAFRRPAAAALHASVVTLAATLFLVPAAAPAEPANTARGRVFFEEETFGGNGRTCATCHRAGIRSLTPGEARRLFAESPDDPLFQTDASDQFGNADETSPPTFGRLLEHATIRVRIPLHPNVMLADDPTARSIVVNRSIPTTINMPAFDPVVMLDGREPSLETQVRSALAAHADVFDIPDEDVADVVAFEKTELSNPALEAFANGGPPPELPQAVTESQKRGRRFFEDRIERTDKTVGFCVRCHSGPLLNQVSAVNPAGQTAAGHLGDTLGDDFPYAAPRLFFRPGDRFSTLFLGEINPTGNPMHVFVFKAPGGPDRVWIGADPGRAAITGRIENVDEFKIPTLWGVKRTAPYFHDNSAKDLGEVLDHYIRVIAPGFSTPMTLLDKEDVIAFLELLE